jgi:hypothetical protein
LAVHKQLRDLIKRIAEESSKYKKTKADSDLKLTVLKEKEESLLARQDAIRLEKQQLDTEKRRFAGTQSLYS